jgi:hypothetical protein
MNVLNDNIFGESDEKGPIPGVQACGIGLETGFGLQVLIQNIEPDSYVKVYSWKQWVLNDIIFGESWNKFTRNRGSLFSIKSRLSFPTK